MPSLLAAQERRGDDRLLAFHGVPEAVRLDSCAELLDPLGAVLGTWPVTDGDRRSEPVLSVSRRKAGYRIASSADDAIEIPTPVSTVCRLVADLVRAFVDANAELLCLHSGAAVIGGRLVVFPSTYRAGKSTLLAGLAATGIRIHADDVLPLDCADRGLALGIAPRLRVPLPAQAGDRLRRIAARCRGPSDGRYLYLRLPRRLLSPFGTSLPIGAFVLLERSEGARAQLRKMPPDAVLAALVERNFSTGPGAPSTLDRLNRLVAGKPCLRLVYDDVGEAADLLKSAFGEAGVPAAHEDEQCIGTEVAPPRAHVVLLARRRLYRRRNGITLRFLDGSTFLADPGSGTIIRLNALASGLWNLLEEPVSAAVAAAIVAAAFPERDPRAIEGDVAGLFHDLREAGMIVPDTRSRSEAVAPRRRSGAQNIESKESLRGRSVSDT